MFTLFFNLYCAMFIGSWTNFTYSNIASLIKTPLNVLGEILTSIFNNVDTSYKLLGDIMTTTSQGVPYYIAIISFVLALITSIGIVVMAVKGIKKIFFVFFYMGR